MKKYIITAMFLTVMAGFTSCNTDTILPENINKEAEVQNEQTLRFAFGLPANEPVVYSQLHESDEYEIEKLDIFEFDGQSNFVKAFMDVQLQPMSNPNFPARQKVAEITLDKGVLGLHSFIFVANHSNWMETPITDEVTIKKDEFIKLLTKKLTDGAAVKPSFLMTAEKRVNIQDASSIDLTASESDIVFLTRAVARIDVGIRLQDRAKETLEIQKVEVMDVPSMTSLFPLTDNYSPNGETSISYKAIAKPELDGYYDDVETERYDSRYKKLFYIYERNMEQYAANGTPTVKITAKYTPFPGGDEATLEYVIPFDKSVERNYLYTFILGVTKENDVYQGTVEIIKVYKWEEDESFEINKRVITLERGSDFTDADLEFDYTTHDVNVKSYEAKTYTHVFTVKTEFEGDNFKLVPVKNNPNYVDEEGNPKDPNNRWITVTAENGFLNIELEENNEGLVRSGLVWLKSSKDEAGKQLYGLRIRQQPKPATP